MEGLRFDQLSLLVARGINRRTALGWIGAAAFSGVSLRGHVKAQECPAVGAACSENSECCDGEICGGAGVCCYGEGVECPDSTACCGGSNCRDGICQICLVEEDECSVDIDCCGVLLCLEGVCTVCQGIDGGCRDTSECCGEMICNDGRCELLEEECPGDGDVCGKELPCCEGYECVAEICALEEEPGGVDEGEASNGAESESSPDGDAVTLPVTGSGTGAESNSIDPGVIVAGSLAVLAAAKLRQQQTNKEESIRN